MLIKIQEFLPAALCGLLTSHARNSPCCSMSYRGWLQQVVLQYPDASRVFIQVDQVLQRIPTLKPKTDNFLRFGPPPKLLICIFGRMDCKYMEAPFSIDIEIWLPSAFPAQAPIVFVVPTFNQRLRASPLVDPTGRISLPYINFWHTRPNASLLEMMNYLHQAFCVEPPVFLDPASSPPSLGLQRHSITQQKATAPVTKGKDLLSLREEVKEKLQNRLRRLQNEIAMDTDRILVQSELLQTNERKIEKGLSNLRVEIAKVEEEIDNVRAKKESLKDQISDLREKGSLDLEKIIVPKGPVSEQIIRAVVEEFAIQDTIYIMGKALEKRKLDLGQYIRNIRELSREHFMRKALLQKINEDLSVISY